MSPVVLQDISSHRQATASPVPQTAGSAAISQESVWSAEMAFISSKRAESAKDSLLASILTHYRMFSGLVRSSVSPALGGQPLALLANHRFSRWPTSHAQIVDSDL